MSRAAAPLAGKRIGLLTAFASRRGGGVAEAVAAQAAMIRSLGAEPRVFALADGEQPLVAEPVELSRVTGPLRFGFAPEQYRRLIEARLDLLHLHGIWMHPSRVGLRWARATGRPYVISPHGMLDRWITARGRWKKGPARLAYERAGWATASRLHALTVIEAADIARESGRGDALVIPNAGPAALRPPTSPPPPTVLYLGRIHPKKNLAALIAGWQLAARPAAARLRIAGWGERGDVAQLRHALAAANEPTIAFLGPVYGADKRRLIEEARFVALPSLGEGLPMAVLEAWAAARPTLMSAACNLPEGFAAGAARDSGMDPDAIARAIERALALDPPGWLAMAEAARTLAAGPFAATTIAARWESAYAALIAGST